MGGGRGRGASVSARFIPSGGGTDRKNSFSRVISRCLDQWLYHTTKKLFSIQLGLNHSFKEISFVCAFVYLFVCLFSFSLAVGLQGASTEVLVSSTTIKKLSSAHAHCHGMERDANWVGGQLIPFNFHV